MPEQTEWRPDDLAPDDGHYEALSVFGSPVGVTHKAMRGERLPALPRGQTWRLILPDAC